MLGQSPEGFTKAWNISVAVTESFPSPDETPGIEFASRILLHGAVFLLSTTVAVSPALAISQPLRLTRKS